MSKNQKISFSEIIKNEERLARKKLEDKLPQWAECEGIELPASVSLEQASSFLTARFKANLLKKILPDAGCIADLTGGYGSDSWAFSKVFGRVLYFEKNNDLYQLARKNFTLLCEKENRELNIECTCREVSDETLGALKVDCIYADPARRSESGKKVFLIEDCLPDMTKLLPAISKVSPYLLIKYSPMADIAMLRERLSVVKDYPVRSIGVVGLGGEVKEVLVLLTRSYSDTCQDSCSGVAEAVLPELFIADVKNGECVPISLDTLDREAVLLESTNELKCLKKPESPNEHNKTDRQKPHSRISKPDRPDSVAGHDGKVTDVPSGTFMPGSLDSIADIEGKVLLEPSAILLKSGYQNAICRAFKAKKIGQDCHLYIARKAPDAGNELARFVKSFEIVECCALSKSALRKIGRRYPKAEVTAKGLHIRSEELASMIGCRSGMGADGRHYHIFGVGNGKQKSIIVTLSI